MTLRSTDIARALFVLTGAIAQVVLGALPFILELENTVASRSAEVQVLLTPASYAFSIWSLIFLGCGIYAVTHLFRMTHPMMRQTGWLAGMAFWLNAAWETWVPFYGIEMVSLVLIMGGWICAVIFSLTSVSQSDVGIFSKAIRAPLFALGGWLNAAAFVNLLIVSEVYGLPWFGEGGVAPSIAILVAATIAAGLVLIRTGSLTYAAALAWGLYAIHVANRDGETLLANAALGAIGLLIVAVLAGWVRQRQTRSSPV